MNVSALTTNDVSKLTEAFIKEFAETENWNTFMEDAGGAVGDLDVVSHRVAKLWVADKEMPASLMEQFWESMKQAAMVRYSLLPEEETED